MTGGWTTRTFAPGNSTFVPRDPSEIGPADCFQNLAGVCASEKPWWLHIAMSVFTTFFVVGYIMLLLYVRARADAKEAREVREKKEG